MTTIGAKVNTARQAVIQNWVRVLAGKNNAKPTQSVLSMANEALANLAATESEIAEAQQAILME